MNEITPIDNVNKKQEQQTASDGFASTIKTYIEMLTRVLTCMNLGFIIKIGCSDIILQHCQQTTTKTQYLQYKSMHTDTFDSQHYAN